MNKIKLFALVLFFCFVPAGNQAISAAPLFDDYLKQGIEDFHSREYQRSYEILLKAFELAPGDYRVNFYLGRGAFELHHYEIAVMTYERALIIKPRDLRVKLEMARAYQKLGMNDMARKYCNQVLLTDPPQAVKQNIEKFLAYINRSEQKHFFWGTLSLGIDWNDNVWASPANNIIPTVIGEITLTGKSAQKTEDTIFLGIADLNHTYLFPYSSFAWQTNLVAYKAFYRKESELDTLYLDIESGPEYVRGKGVTGLQLTADYLDLAESKYSSSLGIKSYYRHMFTPSFVLSPVLAYKNKSYEKVTKKFPKKMPTTSALTLTQTSWSKIFGVPPPWVMSTKVQLIMNTATTDTDSSFTSAESFPTALPSLAPMIFSIPVTTGWQTCLINPEKTISTMLAVE